MRQVRCKPYHESRGRNDPGALEEGPFRKSRCPSWAAEPTFQRRLIDEALPDPAAPADLFGRPKVIWNAVGGTIFIGVSTNEQDEAYNCYPSEPATRLHSELSRRAERTVEAYLAGKESP